ncbi:MAG: type I-D CRISPR-associated protein Cas7/Csc2, partial [Oscillochloris sp.]|nr:type I-D CRISPR-associated protein Cas7/Csc2 [Oscillochloris sp.]
MSLLSTLAADTTIFHSAFPSKPSGRYAHFVLLRETESFPLFQTDGSLNVIRVRGGLANANKDPMTRLILFKRKQSSPERLNGRELLRSVGAISEDKKDKDRYCEYNSADFCKKCPDCILYG